MSPRKLQDIIPQKNRASRPRASLGLFAKKEHTAPPDRATEDTEPPVASKIFRSAPPLFSKTVFHERKKSKLLWVLGVVAIVFIALFFSPFFEEKTTVRVVPRQKVVPLDATFSAQRVGSDKKSSGLLFEPILLNHVETKSIPTTDVTHIDRRASGQVVIYNNYSTQSQRLIKNTRFETPEGLIFRIQESVTVPGQKKSGGLTTPGSVEVTVYAEDPGEKYNVGLRDFTIPGFKGTPRYEGFYARSKTEIAGGFSGTINIVPETLLQETKRALQETAREKLLASVGSKVPEQFILYPDAVFLVFEREKVPPEQGDLGKNSVDVSVYATLHGFLFNKSALSEVISKKLIPDLEAGDRVIVQNLDALKLSLKNKVAIDPVETDEVSFSLAGDPSFEWVFDEKELQEALRGKPKNSLETVVAGFPNIVKVEILVRPLWNRSISEDPEKIFIEKVLE